MTNTSKTIVVGLFFLPVLSGCGQHSAPTPAETYPSRAIKLVVPFGPGGGTDTFARILAKAIEDNDLLPQPLVIINREGAGATIGSRSVKDAVPDGYTLLILHEALFTAKYSGMVAYGPESFEAIAGCGEVGMVIAVAEDARFANLGELLETARDQPGTITFGANLGASTHFAALEMEQAMPGARFRFVQSGGGAKRFSEIMGGHVDVTGFSIEEFVRFAPAGLRGLAFFGDQRQPAAPQVPTAREQGFDIANSNMFFWWAPKGTAAKRMEVIATAVQQAMKTPYVRQKMAEIHCKPICIRGPQLTERIAKMDRRVARVSPRPTTPLPNFPLLVTGAIGCVAIVLAVGAWRGRQSRREAVTQKGAGGLPHADLRRVCVSIALTLVYVLLMSVGWLSFRWATVLYVLATGALLVQFRPRSLAWIAALSLAMGFGLHYLFTQHFVVDLP